MKLIQSLLVFVFFVSCTTSRVYVKRKFPPQNSISKKYKTISIDPISGDHDNKFKAQLTRYLIEEKSFKVIDRDSNQDLITKKFVSNRSKRQHPDLIIKGRYYERMDYATDGKSGSIAGIANLDIVDNKTGEILLSKKVWNSQSTGYFQPHEDVITPTERSVRLNLCKKFISYIIPYKDYYEHYKFIDKEYPKLREGHTYLDNNEYKKSLNVFEEILKTEKSLPPKIKGHATYGKSVSLGHLEKYKQAHHFLDEAYKVNQEKQYLEHHHALNDLEANQKKLKEWERRR